MAGRVLPALLVPLLVALSSLVLADDADGGEPPPERPAHLLRWVPQTAGVCTGSANGFSTTDRPDVVEHFRLLYQNCTRILGNLELTHINVPADTDLPFFDSIEEIKGYLLIYSVNLTRISFKRLRIIWGDNTFNGAAIHLQNLKTTEVLSMPSLRSIEKGDLVVQGGDALCHLNSTVDFTEILHPNASSRIRWNSKGNKRCSVTPKCDEKCSLDGGFCWGPGEADCQSIYRRFCPSYCDSGMCFKDEKGKWECCHGDCTAGCTGVEKDKCYACKHQIQNGVCVEQCTSLFKYNDKLGIRVPNPDGYYTWDRYCFKECPSETLIEGEHCVVHCGEGYFHDMLDLSRRCEPCRGPCRKRCRLDGPLSAENIDSLANCTQIEGSLDISTTTITGFQKQDDPHNYTSMRKVPGLEERRLEILSSVKAVSGFVSVTMREHSPHDLSFLRNLEVIEGRRLNTEQFALVISSNDNLRELGLSSLRQIKKGGVVITRNAQLCLANTIEWKTILLSDTLLSKARVKDNRKDDFCSKRDNVSCHKTCDAKLGCWGEGSGMCQRCAFWKQGRECKKDCNEKGFYKNFTSKTCMACDPRCTNCTGPTNEDCGNHCKSVFRKVDGRFRCLERCDVDEFAAKNSECRPCHKACYDHGCNGPSDTLGGDGCSSCRFAVARDGRIERCLYVREGQEKNLCAQNNLTNFFARTSSEGQNVTDTLCEECNEECSRCSLLGALVKEHGCECKNYRAKEPNGNERCVSRCGWGTFVVEEKTEKKAGICGRCDRLCDQQSGCTGPTSRDCVSCRNATLPMEGGGRECFDECPPSAPFFTRNDKFCHEKDVDRLRRERMRIVVGVVVCAAVAVAGVVAFIVYRCNRYKKELQREKKLNEVVLPELRDIASDETPNMTRLNLISKDLLTKNPRTLGHGAFGVVYAGYWYPNGKNGVKVPVAIKVVQDPTGKAQEEMLEEASTMAKMRHENLLRLVGVCLGEGIQLVTPLRPLGNLLDFLQKHKHNLGGKDLLSYCLQIASAMEYLYHHRLVHRDLAARNVLVKKTNHVEVTDFGLAKMLEHGKEKIYVEGKVAVKWLAIESLLYKVYDHQTDVWAFGVTCWEILTFGQSPYQGLPLSDIKEHLLKGERLPQPNTCSQELYTTLLHCWLENADSRPTFVVLKEKFWEYCRAPRLFVEIGQTPQRMDSINSESQRELINELLEDKDDFADPLDYFDDEDLPSSSSVVPPTPTSPTHKPLIGGGGGGQRTRRLPSTGSQRYQTEPRRGAELGTDEGNYLVPTRNMDNAAQLYTPVVVRNNGQTELVSRDYYNEVGGKSEYENDVGGGGGPRRLDGIEEEGHLDAESVV